MNGAFRQEAEKGVPHARRALFHFASPEEGEGLPPNLLYRPHAGTVESQSPHLVPRG